MNSTLPPVQVVPTSASGGSRLLQYRAYRGRFRGPLAGSWAIARTGLNLIFRRKLFWTLYGCGLLIFLFFFFAQYLMAHFSAQFGEQNVRFNPSTRIEVDPSRFVSVFREQLKMNGTGETYRNFIWWEANIVMAVLAFSGAMLVGNDFRFGSLPFYLSKPLNRWHYVLGKALAISVFINLMTTLPALVLWLEYGLLDEWSYYYESIGLAVGILGYGLVLSVVLSLMLVAAASWLRRTVPLIMVWTAVFVFGAQLGRMIFRISGEQPNWKLFDLWNNAYLVGNWCMRLPEEKNEPWVGYAALVLAVVCGACVGYLNRRIRAIEVIAS